ncbi:MAG: ATP-binding protein, partial [Melioribacteraceae bacterium]|nr:ATP-binding protein [Melioribacteraceae bacterium]
MESLLGYDHNELVGKNINTIIPEPYKHKHNDYLKKHRRYGKQKFVNSIRTVVVVKKDGKYLPAELSISKISDDRIVGIFRKMSLIDMLYDGIIGMYMNRIIMANEIVADIFDCKLNNMIGNKITKYITKNDLKNELIDIQNESESTCKTYKLSKIEVDVEVCFILITEMKEMNLIRNEKHMVDILNNELKEKVEENEKLLRVKTDFLANMSHEIRTPMNGIYGMLSLLKDTKLDGIQDNYLNVCRRSAEALMAVLDDVLLISKSGTGNIELENISFNLAELVEDVVDIASHAIDESKNIDLVYYIDPKISSNIIGDPTRLRQILNNLMSNAVKFTHLGEVALEVSLIKSDPFTIQFEVNDTGIGMTPEEVEKIFKPFVQADSSTTRNYGGTGLGLVICKQLVELFGGKMEVKSRAGRGSTFMFTIETAPDKYSDK